MKSLGSWGRKLISGGWEITDSHLGSACSGWTSQNLDWAFNRWLRTCFSGSNWTPESSPRRAESTSATLIDTSTRSYQLMSEINCSFQNECHHLMCIPWVQLTFLIKGAIIQLNSLQDKGEKISLRVLKDEARPESLTQQNSLKEWSKIKLSIPCLLAVRLIQPWLPDVLQSMLLQSFRTLLSGKDWKKI